MTKQEIIEKRKGYIPYEEARRLQSELIRIYEKEHKPNHTDEVYLKLILDWDVIHIKERHPQNNNYTDTVFECFSEVSQHVYGYTKKHCLDQVYEAVQQKERRVADYKKLPTLAELVSSDIEIDPEKTYSTKEKGGYEDSCNGYGGGDILEMRRIGIDEYRRKSLNEFNRWMLSNK